MSDGAGPALVERGHAAAARGDWQHAFDLFTEADAAGVLSAADLPVLGEVAYAAGHLDVSIETWERAHAAYLRAGDKVAAAGAAVRVAMHLLFDTAPRRRRKRRSKRHSMPAPQTRRVARPFRSCARSSRRFSLGWMQAFASRFQAPPSTDPSRSACPSRR